MPDLARAQARVESLMIDSCKITRDAQQELDDVLDVDTGQLEAPDDDSLFVYYGACIVKPNKGYRQTDVGGETTAERYHDLLIPLGAPEVKIGDRVEIAVASRDPQLVGSRFVVTDSIAASFAVVRRIEMERVVE